ncbi:MAG TPA: hypothetical protein QF455_02820, partial [Phycisphaerales bacterium]|nr:hypothetical protein [Phycisphaerales bacterium]
MIAGLLGVIASLGAAPLAQEAPSQPAEVTAFGGVAIAIDRDLVAEINIGDRCTISLPTGQREPLSLELERFEVFTKDAKVVVAKIEGGRIVEHEVPQPTLAVFRGHVTGD